MPTDTPNPGLLLILSGPSGVGKTTIAHRVVEAFDAVFSVSVTTRPPRPKDRPGVDYDFLDRAEFERRRDAGELLEWAEVFGNLYGTPRGPVESAMRDGRVVLLEIDVAGAEQVKRNLPAAFGVFILPPSEAALLDRLRARGQDSEQVIQRRFQKAKDEIARAKAGDAYDRFLTNDDLDRAVEETIDLVRAELNRRRGSV